MPRIYQNLLLQLHQTVTLTDQASHHLARVLRAQVGDELTIFNGQGGEYEARITQISKKNVQVELQVFQDRDVESPIRIQLAQGVAKGERMDIIVQKAVELGVTHITPLITERCNVRLDKEREEKRLAHWQAVIVSACEQSGRNRLPVLEAPVAYSAWLQTAKADLAFVLSPHVKEKLPERNLANNASIILLIGPEGGLSDQEVTAAVHHQFLPLNLGPRVLRTETATLAALSALQLQYGDFA